jgi:hypothetical protein
MPGTTLRICPSVVERRRVRVDRCNNASSSLGNRVTRPGYAGSSRCAHSRSLIAGLQPGSRTRPLTARRSGSRLDQDRIRLGCRAAPSRTRAPVPRPRSPPWKAKLSYRTETSSYDERPAPTMPSSHQHRMVNTTFASSSQSDRPRDRADHIRASDSCDRFPTSPEGYSSLLLSIFRRHSICHS